jgi:hypothetical protein
MKKLLSTKIKIPLQEKLKNKNKQKKIEKNKK